MADFSLGELGTYSVEEVDDSGTPRIVHKINGNRVWSLTVAGGHVEPVKHGGLAESDVHLSLDGEGYPLIPNG